MQGLIPFKEILGKKLLLLDGAMGTELERRGFKCFLPLWSARALIDSPELVKQIHKEYIESGAEIITTNTFRVAPVTLAKVGKEHLLQELIFKAVKLAKDAIKECNKPVYVAGSMAPAEDCFSPEIFVEENILRDNHYRISVLFKEAGVDFVLIETMNSLREAIIALEESLKTQLPVILSVVVDENNNLLSGDSLIQCMKIAEKKGVVCFMVNCISPDLAVNVLKVMKENLNIPYGIYPNAGLPVLNQDGVWVFPVMADEFLNMAKIWLTYGVSIIGSCCGSTPEYTKLLRNLIYINQ